VNQRPTNLHIAVPAGVTTSGATELKPMDVDTIRSKVKESIHKVTGIEPATISDSAAYVDDLGLDSLSILEIAVSVEEQFKFQANDEELSAIRTVDDTVELVKRHVLVEVL
jgi:acyl carrier protein